MPEDVGARHMRQRSDRIRCETGTGYGTDPERTVEPGAGCPGIEYKRTIIGDCQRIVSIDANRQSE